MRILIAIGVPRQSEAGAAIVALSHARELEKLGHTLECWFLEDVLAKPPRIKRFEALIFAVALAGKIAKRRKEFDVVDLHAPWGCAYGILRKAKSGRGLPPYVFTMQGSEEWYVKMMREEQRKGRASNFAWKNRLWHRLYHQTMYDLSIRTAAFGAIANSAACMLAERKYEFAPGRLRYVPNGTEERFFIPRDRSSASASRLLFVGTWLDRKGIFYLADAFQKIAERSADVRLTVAGCIASEREVKDFFPQNVRGRLCVLPLVKRDDMPKLYAGHDIFVFPSLVEGMPLSLLEAMATGMPVVTTTACGMADVVEDGVNGLLVPPADANQLAAAVIRLLDSSELRAKLGQAAQQSMRRYTWQASAAMLEQVFSTSAAAGKN